jgi:hypothetical protein
VNRGVAVVGGDNVWKVAATELVVRWAACDQEKALMTKILMTSAAI